MEGRTGAHDRFRRVLSNFATGVTIVTGRTEAGSPVGFTANAFTSVSLDPPLVLVCADLASESLPVLRDSGRFAVSVLRAEDRDVALRFSQEIRHERFVELALGRAPSGLPLLESALAWMDCRVRRIIEAGDHAVLIGEVMGCGGESDGRPLVFFRGEFGTFGTLE
ncbi:MAG: flavin reductase family protein [Gemmatimonadota bacterium]